MTVKFGLIVRGKELPAWQLACIRELLTVPGAELALAIVPDQPRASRQGIRGVLRGNWLWSLFNRVWVERRSKASAPIDASDVLDVAPMLRCRTEPHGRYGEGLSEGDIAQVKAYDLDFILCFGFGTLQDGNLQGGILDAARLGLWSFHHGDEREYRGSPPGFWELWDRRATGGAILQVVTDGPDGDRVVQRGTFRTFPHSYRKTRDELFFGSVGFPARMLRDIIENGTDPRGFPSSSTNPTIKHDPGSLLTLRFLVRQAGAFLAHLLRTLFLAPKWTVGVVDAPIESLLSGSIPADVHWLPEPSSTRYLADPFPLPDGRIIAEDFEYRTRRGRIVSLDPERPSPKPAMPLEVHASYPYVVQDGADIFCVPEIAGSRQVRLYRLDPGRDEWMLERTLLEGIAALDTTIFHWNGRWWLFCTDLERGSNQSLYIFHATGLPGPWRPHPLNPVKADVTSSRPGGTPFEHGGALYRPAQDDSVSYGGSLVLCRVDALTEHTFEETIVARLRPHPSWRYGAGMHTVAAWGDRMLIDARRETFIWVSLVHEVTARLTRSR